MGFGKKFKRYRRKAVAAVKKPVSQTVNQAQKKVKENVKGVGRLLSDPHASAKRQVSSAGRLIGTLEAQATSNIKGLFIAAQNPKNAADRLRHRVTAEARRLPSYNDIKSLEKQARPALQIIGEWVGPVVAMVVGVIPIVGPAIAAAVLVIDLLLKTAYAAEKARIAEGRAENEEDRLEAEELHLDEVAALEELRMDLLNGVGTFDLDELQDMPWPQLDPAQQTLVEESMEHLNAWIDSQAFRFTAVTEIKDAIVESRPARAVQSLKHKLIDFIEDLFG